MENNHSRIGTEKQSVSFIKVVEGRIRHFSQIGKGKTASNYTGALRHFMKFTEGKDMTLEDITTALMKDFQAYLIAAGLKMNTVSLHNRMLRAAYNYALDEGLLQYDRRPFAKVFTGQEKTLKRALRESVVKKIMTMDLGNRKNLRFTRDIFLFSIYTQGMAFVDIAHLKKTQIRNKCLIYRRRKTNQYLNIAIHPCAQAIIDRYRISDSQCSYVFPILYDPDMKKNLKYDTALRLYNAHLAKIGLCLNLETPLSSYVSRHTWASLAKWNGISNTVISEAMGHSNINTTNIYLASFDTGVITDANAKIINSLVKDDKPL